jgi:hypothetical protein
MHGALNIWLDLSFPSIESVVALLVSAVFARPVSAVLICDRFCKVTEPSSCKGTPDRQEGIVVTPKPAAVRGVEQ